MTEWLEDKEKFEFIQAGDSLHEKTRTITGAFFSPFQKTDIESLE